MYGDFVLFDDAGKLEKGERVYLGDVRGQAAAAPPVLARYHGPSALSFWNRRKRPTADGQ